MNNDQSDCPKCYRKFHNKGSLAHHLETCCEDQQKIFVEEKDPLALDVPGEDKVEMDETEEEILELLEEEKKPLTHVQPIPAGRKLLKAPLVSLGGGRGKRGRLDCYYCAVTTSDRISLTKHLVGQHWDQVRDRQGGGRRDNRQYYSNLQDSRVLKPGLNRNANYHSGNIPPPNRKIFPKPTPPTYNWAARIRDQDFKLLNKKVTTSGTVSPSVSRFSNSLFGKTPNRKIAPKPIIGGTVKPSATDSVPFYGRTPNRKIAPRPSSSGTVSTSVTKSVPFYGKTPNRKTVLTPSNSVITSGGLIQAKRSIPTVDLTVTRPSGEQRRGQSLVSRARALPVRSTIPNTNHRSLNKVGPNSELDKLVKKFANSNSNLQITKVSK